MNAASQARFNRKPGLRSIDGSPGAGVYGGRRGAPQRFLAVTGLGPHNLRQAASDPAFLASVLDYVAADEGLLVAFAADRRRAETVARADEALAGPPSAGDP